MLHLPMLPTSDISMPNPHASIPQRFATAAADASQSIGSFAITAAASSYLPNPFLRIEDLPDPLALPCTPAQVLNLISISQPAYSLHTPQHPNTYFIPSHHINFCHPRWNVALANLVVDVRTQLAVPTPFVAHFHGLFIQSNGAALPLNSMQCPSAPHIFGALVVTLPSLHEGGDLILRHNGIQFVLSSGSEQGSYDMQYAAFYLTCDHEMQTVTNGYRVTLLYHLQLADHSLPTPIIPSHAPNVQIFRDIANDWQRKSFSKPSSTVARLCCLLQSSYADEFSWQSLYGPDAALFNILQTANCFDLFLVSLRSRKNTNSIFERFPHGYTIDVHDFISAPGQSTPSMIKISITPEDFAQVDLLSQNSGKVIFGEQAIAAAFWDETWYQSIAIVLWPKSMFISAIPCNVATSLIHNAVEREDRDSLYGCKDASEFLSRYLRRLDYSMIPYNSILSYFLKGNVSVEPVQILLKQVEFSSFTLNLFFPIFQELVNRHSFSSLKESISCMLTSRNNSSDEAVVAACWKLLREMQDYSCASSREEKKVLESITESLVPLLSHDVVEATKFRASLLHESLDIGAFESLTAIPTLTIVSVLTCLHSLGRDDILSDAIGNITRNTTRFIPCLHLCSALSKLLTLNYGISSNEHMMELAMAMVSGLQNDPITARQQCDVGKILNVSLSFGICKDAVMQVMKHPRVYSPLGRVFPAIVQLWKGSADQLKEEFELYAGVMIRCVRDATSDESNDAKEGIIVGGLEILKCMDSLCVSDIQSDTSYQLQFAKALMSRGEIFHTRSIAQAMLVSLEQNLDIAKDAAAKLISHSLNSLRDEIAEDATVWTKDWKLAVPASLTCNCPPCARVIEFLKDPAADQLTIRGAHMKPGGITAVALMSESSNIDSEFHVTLFPKTARGKLCIIKNSQGRVPVKEMLEHESKKKLNGDLLVKLETLMSIIAPNANYVDEGKPTKKEMEVIEI